MVEDAPASVFDAIVSSGRADLGIRNNKGFRVFHVAAYSGNIRFAYI